MIFFPPHPPRSSHYTDLQHILTQYYTNPFLSYFSMTKVICVTERQHCNLARKVHRKQHGTTYTANKPAANVAKILIADHMFLHQNTTAYIFHILHFVFGTIC